MEPAEFLLLFKDAGGAASPARIYVPFSRSTTPETFLTLHPGGGRFQAAPYSGMLYIDGDERGWTAVSLLFSKMRIDITGRQLAPVFEAIRTRTAAHLHAFDGALYDPPEPGQPVIMAIAYAMQKPAA